MDFNAHGHKGQRDFFMVKFKQTHLAKQLCDVLFVVSKYQW